MSLSLKDYYKLSNIAVKEHPPFYLTGRYFANKIKIGGADKDGRTYNFTHARKYIRDFCQLFHLDKSCATTIKELIHARREDNEIYNSIMEFIKAPQLPTHDWLIEHAKSKGAETNSIAEINTYQSIQGADFFDVNSNIKLMKNYDIIVVNQSFMREANYSILRAHAKTIIEINNDCANIDVERYFRLVNETMRVVFHQPIVVKYFSVYRDLSEKNQKKFETIYDKKNNPLRYYYHFIY